MSEPVCVLDNLVFCATSLEERSEWTIHQPPSTEVILPRRGSEAALRLPVPLFARRPHIGPHEPSWSEYCTLLRRFGIPLYASVASLESLATANTPSRFAMRYSDYPLEELEVTTSDAFELVCRRAAAAGVTDLPNDESCNASSTWPIEVQNRSQLSSLISLLADVSGGNTPIGIGLPLGCARSDIQAAVECGFDFITLESLDSPTAVAAAQLDVAAHSVVVARQLVKSLGHPDIPVLLDVPIDSSDHLIKLLALGATAVSIDGMAAALTPIGSPSNSTTVGSGMLSSIILPTAASRTLVAKLEVALLATLQRMKSVLSTCGSHQLADLDRYCLASSDLTATKLTGVPMLEA